MRIANEDDHTGRHRADGACQEPAERRGSGSVNEGGGATDRDLRQGEVENSANIAPPTMANHSRITIGPATTPAIAQLRAD